MADQILKDAAQLGSTLTAFASRQLETVLTELRGPVGGEAGANAGDSASLGTLAGNVMQIVNQVGSLLMQVSQYDLVRSNANVMLLSSPNSISSHTVRAGVASRYELLLENNGRRPAQVEIHAALHEKKPLEPSKVECDVGERRRVQIHLPELSEGKYALIVVAKIDGEVVARKTIALNVLPQPQLHNP
jgi:hypothetical protein